MAKPYRRRHSRAGGKPRRHVHKALIALDSRLRGNDKRIHLGEPVSSEPSLRVMKRLKLAECNRFWLFGQNV